MDEHYPRRGDAVEAWLKVRRDEFGPHGVWWRAADMALEWRTVDSLLNEYRLRSDYGRSLVDDIEGLQ